MALGIVPSSLRVRAPAAVARMDRWTAIRAAAIAGYVVVLSVLSIQQWASFVVYDADLAINVQLAWNAAHGRPFASTLIEHAEVSLGDHFSFVQLVNAPLLWVWPDPRALLISQSVWLGIAALPLGWIADRRLGSRALGTVFVVALLLSPLLHFINLFEYHEVAPAVAAVLFVFWAIEARRGRLAIALTVLMLTVKEEMAIVGVMLGVYAALLGRQRRLGVGIGLLSAIWGMVVMGVIMPRLSLAGDTFYYVRRYSQYGDDIGSIALNLARQPWILVGDLIAPPRPLWYLQLLAPLAALPLLSPGTLLVAAPVVGYLALGNSPAQYAIQYHYAAPLLPVLVMSAVAGAARLIAWRVPPWAIGGALLAATIVAMYAWGPLPGMRAHDPAKYVGGEHATIITEFLAAIPPDAPVSAGRNLVSRVAQRERVYNFPTVRDAQYVLIDNKGLVPPGFFEVDGFALSAFVRNPAFRLVDAEDGVWLFVRDAPPPPPPTVVQTAQFGDSIRLLGYDLGPGRRDGALALRLWWQADARPEDRYAVFVHLLNADGVRVWQHDSEPLDGLFITTEWPTGRPIPDRRVIEVRGLPPGMYRLVVGLYEWGGGDRLPVPGTAGTPFQDSVVLGPFVLPR